MKSYVVLAPLALAVAVAASGLAACRPASSGHDEPDAAMAALPDAPDGTGCTALTPRSEPPEAFIGPTGFEARMGALIDGATSTLDVQMYLFTVSALANKLIAAKQRGVVVRVLLDPDHDGNLNVTPALTAAGVDWKKAPSLYTFAHAKYLIVDKSQVVIMSANWNLDAMRSERNYGIVDRDIEDIADVQAIFDADWSLASGGPPITADLACTRLIVSPTNSKQRLLELIDSATTNLDVEVMYISETGVRDAIAAAKQRGVDVRIIINEPTSDSIVYLKSLGIPIKKPATFSLHAKLIIADEVAFVGSANMSFTSLTKNREVGALAFEPSTFQPIKQQFDADWAVSTTVP
jgi:phosphatidylserine/phosphatidylglycerophosphate/cardiolipin synthase-like enzyme